MSIATLRRAAPYLLYGLVTILFCAPLFEHPNGLGILDWDQHLFYYGSVIKSIVEYGQLPFWNPWYCGGNVLWQNPQVPLLSPVFPLAMMMSLPLAMTLNIVVHYWVGLIGMHLLLTSALGLSAAPVVFYLSIVAVMAGAPALHVAVGHSVFLPCLYLPLQLFFVVRGMKSGAVRDLILAGALLALMIVNGAMHAVPMSVAMAGLLGLFGSVGQRRWRPLVAGAVICVAGFALAAPKLLPVTLFVTSERFTDVRTVIERPDQMTVEMLSRTYLDPFQSRGLRFPLQRHGWYEYGNYIGGAAVLLIAASIALAFFIDADDRWLGRSLALTTLVLLVLSAGEFHRWAPASLVNAVPLFSSFRIPSRYTIVVVICGVTTVAWVLARGVLESPPLPAARLLMTLLCLLAAFDVTVRNREQLRGVFSQSPLEERFHWGAASQDVAIDPNPNPYTADSPMLHAMMRNRMFFNCYESLQLLRTADATQPLLYSDGGARIVDTRFSPNRIDFSVIGGRETSAVFLNQNFAPGWRSTAGPLSAKPVNSVTLAPGQTGRFAFIFTPPGLTAGWTFLALALGASGLFWRRHLG